MPLRRFLRAYYAYVFLTEFMLGYAVYAIWFQLGGLGVWEIAMLFAIWSALAVVFELPSGALSDHFDRRWLLVAAPVIKALTFVCWTFAGGSFALFALGFIVWSFAESLVSGTPSALLYERMESAGASDEYGAVFGRGRGLAELSAGTAIALGGVAGHFNMQGALLASLGPLLFAAIVALRLVDLRREAASEARPSYFSHFGNALGEFRRHADIRFITLYISLGMTVYGVIEEFDALYMLALGLPIWAFGALGVAIYGSRATANFLAHRLSGRPSIGWLLPLISGSLLVAAGSGETLWLLIPLVLAHFVAAPVYVLSEAKFQRVMEGSSRATTTSALYAVMEIASILFILGFGAAAALAGIIPAYSWTGVYLIGFALWAAARHRAGRRITG